MTNYASGTRPHIVYVTGDISRVQVYAEALDHLIDFPSVTANDIGVSLTVPVGRGVVALEGKVDGIRPGVGIVGVRRREDDLQIMSNETRSSEMRRHTLSQREVSLAARSS